VGGILDQKSLRGEEMMNSKCGMTGAKE